MSRDAAGNCFVPVVSETNAGVKQASILSTTGQVDFELKVNQVLESEQNSYIVQRFIGAGAFGQVIKCRDARTSEMVAIKMLKSNSAFTREGDREIRINRDLARARGEDSYIARYIEHLFHESYKCLVFEALDESLYDFLNRTNRQPVEVQSIQTIVGQLLVALIKLKSLGIVHSDLTPQNIMIDNRRKIVKLIDFGSASRIDAIRLLTETPCMQSLWYRCPEIILGLPFSEIIDMWSLGCIMVELFTGSVLYHGASQYEVLRLVTECQGLPPTRLLNMSPKAANFFGICKAPGTSILVWRLKLRHELGFEPRCRDEKSYARSYFSSFIEINFPIDLNASEREVETKDREKLVDLLHLMMELDQDNRIPAEYALNHPFITGGCLSEEHNALSAAESNDSVKGSAQTPLSTLTNAESSNSVTPHVQDPAPALNNTETPTISCVDTVKSCTHKPNPVTSPSLNSGVSSPNTAAQVSEHGSGTSSSEVRSEDLAENKENRSPQAKKRKLSLHE